VGAPIAILAFILVWMMISHSRTISDLKEHNSQLHAAVYKKEKARSNLEKTSFDFQSDLVASQTEQARLESKLSDALDKLKNLEDFFERHQHAHKAHGEEKALWEKEKKYLHDEIEKIRDNFRDTRQLNANGGDPQLAQKLLEEQAKTKEVPSPVKTDKESPGEAAAEAVTEKTEGGSDGGAEATEEVKEEGQVAEGGDKDAKTKSGKDLTATIVKQFKHHRFSYGAGDEKEKREPATEETAL